MKVYTKTGDSGTTSLFGGRRVDKNSSRIKAYGEVDELNSLVGVILADLEEGVRGEFAVEPLKRRLLRIQLELFVLGADLATPKDVSTSLKLRGASKIPRVTKSFITRLEKEIDAWSRDLPQLKNFILPRGGKVGSKLHFARTIARRAERSIVDLAEGEKVNKYALSYINRLSDWLFTLARLVNQMEGFKEIPWKGRNKYSITPMI